LRSHLASCMEEAKDITPWESGPNSPPGIGSMVLARSDDDTAGVDSMGMGKDIAKSIPIPFSPMKPQVQPALPIVDHGSAVNQPLCRPNSMKLLPRVSPRENTRSRQVHPCSKASRGRTPRGRRHPSVAPLRAAPAPMYRLAPPRKKIGTVGGQRQRVATAASRRNEPRPPVQVPGIDLSRLRSGQERPADSASSGSDVLLQEEATPHVGRWHQPQPPAQPCQAGSSRSQSARAVLPFSPVAPAGRPARGLLNSAYSQKRLSRQSLTERASAVQSTASSPQRRVLYSSQHQQLHSDNCVKELESILHPAPPNSTIALPISLSRQPSTMGRPPIFISAVGGGADHRGWSATAHSGGLLPTRVRYDMQQNSVFEKHMAPGGLRGLRGFLERHDPELELLRAAGAGPQDGQDPRRDWSLPASRQASIALEAQHRELMDSSMRAHTRHSTRQALYGSPGSQWESQAPSPMSPSPMPIEHACPEVLELELEQPQEDEAKCKAVPVTQYLAPNFDVQFSDQRRPGRRPRRASKLGSLRSLHQR
jgi:hypothetical protein